VWQNDNNDVLTPIVKNWADFIFKLMVLVLIHFYIFLGVNFFYTLNPIDLVLESSFLFVFLIGYFKVIFSPVLLYGSPKIENISNTTTVSKLYITKVWIVDLNGEINNPRDVLINKRVHEKVFTYIEQIEKVGLVNYSFRKQDYSINELSTELGLPKYYLEFIFKYYCKVSFNEYKKIVRIYDAVNLINDGYLSTNTLDTLSRHVGFASYNPFLINFKEILGVSPFDYYKSQTILRNKIVS
jgi:AraC-like DNA-binding protein